MTPLLPQRLRLTLRGAVQGVGFRPFVYRLATELGLAGWVNNSSQGVAIEVEGERRVLETFAARLEAEKPPQSQVQSLETDWLEAEGQSGFEIRSSLGGEKTTIVLPDLATCPDCWRDIFTPQNRRYRYPFTNCTNCGPRYTIVEALPYDRGNTTLKDFSLCPDCQREYADPLDRRFHAQPNACPRCGPQLAWWDRQGQVLARREAALLAAVQGLRQGKILAIKGLGGFHLTVDASNPDAVSELRRRKRRPDKPLALMYPSWEAVEAHCQVSPLEKTLLRSPAAPIVLLKRQSAPSPVPPLPCPAVAPGNPYWGVMLPYTPLHHLLLGELGFPLVATSGNLAGEPICTDETEALQRLGSIADAFLVHNRPIARPVDDSVACTMGGRELVLRRARGYAPFPITLKAAVPTPLLAVGGQLKNAVAIARHDRAFISQHVGDLETAGALAAFQAVKESLQRLYDFQPAAIACDAHPDSLAAQFSLSQNLPRVKIQHHWAHVLACMADNEIDPPVLGVAWDGTGYGLDGTIWGGEFLHLTGETWQRAAHFRPFRLPGGERAVREPRRAALGLLYELSGSGAMAVDLPPGQEFSAQELGVIERMLSRSLNAPLTSSAGRLFDGVASLLELRQRASFEGQAAMELEFAIAGTVTEEAYPFALRRRPSLPTLVDWEGTVRGVLADRRQGVPRGRIAAKFHNTLVEMAVAVAESVGERQVVLTGGCFQNRYLTERAIRRLREEGFSPFWHRRVPPNDGGLALGQILGASLLVR